MSDLALFLGGMLLGFIGGWKISDAWYDSRQWKKNWKGADL